MNQASKKKLNNRALGKGVIRSTIKIGDSEFKIDAPNSSKKINTKKTVLALEKALEKGVFSHIENNEEYTD